MTPPSPIRRKEDDPRRGVGLVLDVPLDLGLAVDVPDTVVISIMGHSDAAVLRRYREVAPDLMRDGTTRREALLADSRPYP